MDVLINKKDVDILSTVNDAFFDSEHIFDAKKGFAFAAAFTAYDGNPEPILKPEYGELVFTHFGWGPLPDGTYTTYRNKIDSHVCTDEELNLDGNSPNPLFLPVNEKSLVEVKSNKKKLMCVSRDDYYIYGDYNSYKASQFSV